MLVRIIKLEDKYIFKNDDEIFLTTPNGSLLEVKKKKHAKDRKKKRLRTGNVHVLEKNIERDNSYPKPFINQSNEPIPNRFIN